MFHPGAPSGAGNTFPKEHTDTSSIFSGDMSSYTKVALSTTGVLRFAWLMVVE